MSYAEQRMDIDRLVREARGGEPKALNELIAWQMPMIRRCAARYHIPGMVTEDLEQEGLLGLMRALRLYRPEQSSFSTYAARCVASELASAARDGLAGKNIPLSDYIMLEDVDAEPSAALQEATPEEQFLAEELTREWRTKIETLLSVYERQVLNAYLSGYPYSAIASLTSSSAKAVDNALQRVRRKLRPE